MTDAGKSVLSSADLIWQHKAQFLAGDYRVDPKDHARHADACPLCQSREL